MKASLQLKLGQQLTMTPQLQQAIRLLQLSTLELQQEIQQALDANPLLEQEDEFNQQESITELSSSLSNEQQAAESAQNTSEASSSQANEEYEQGNDLSISEQIPDELVVDSNWDDIYTHSPTSHGISSDEDWQQDQGSTGDGLQERLLWQLNLTPMSERDLLIAHSIMDGIDDSGYLRESLEDILTDLNHRQTADEEPYDLDELEAVLKLIQQFDPPGVAARDLRECLLLQLELVAASDCQQLACLLVDQHLAALGSKDYPNLLRQLGIREQQLKEAIELIQSLKPKPGADFSADKEEYILPDVVVYKDKKTNHWRVELNPEVAPKIRINTSYASLAKGQSDGQYFKDQLQEARWLIKSIESRNETLLKVASKIVERQIDFFKQGIEFMKPMVLADIASDIDMHESTISRVTNQKFMHTPRGLFELKYFFSSHVSTTGGGEASSTAIRAMIKKLISEENSRKPLSDAKLTKLLESKGIVVARRTVAKYRESMNIAPSNERKSLT